jgi:AcrR family transcriptional regulator
MATSKDARAEILAIARDLFITWGYHGLSMRQIAQAVGVTKAALYYHFEDKEALFLAVLRTHLEEIEQLILDVEAEGGTCRQRIRLLVTRILRQPVEQRAVIRLASQEIVHVSPSARQAFRATYHEKFIGRIRAILEVGLTAGELRAVDGNLATWALLGMMYPHLSPAHAEGVELSDEAIDQMLTIYLDGVTAPGTLGKGAGARFRPRPSLDRGV